MNTPRKRACASLRLRRRIFLDKGFNFEDFSTISLPKRWLVASSSNPHGGGLFSWLRNLEVGEFLLAKTFHGFQNWMVDSSLFCYLADVLSRTFSQQVMRYR